MDNEEASNAIKKRILEANDIFLKGMQYLGEKHDFIYDKQDAEVMANMFTAIAETIAKAVAESVGYSTEECINGQDQERV